MLNQLSPQLAASATPSPVLYTVGDELSALMATQRHGLLCELILCVQLVK